MKQRRTRYEASYKAKVALEACREIKTQQTIADEHGIHPNQVLRWKQRLIERLGEVFEQSRQHNAARDELQKQLTDAQKTIEQLRGEVEFMKQVITAEPSSTRLQFVESNHKSLSVNQQCELLGVSRSSYYAQSREDSREHQDVADVLIILEVLRELPFYGYRKISRHLLPEYPRMTRKRVRRLMHRSGLRAIFPKHRTTRARKDHQKYPYLLKNKVIRYPNQVWASDITYLRLPSGFVYLVVIMDLYSRKVLSWRLSNTMEASFCIEALEEALERYGTPAIFNSDQGCQYTSEGFISVLKKHHIKISMDGKGRALDNIYVSCEILIYTKEWPETVTEGFILGQYFA